METSRAISLLRERGHRVTPQRIEVINMVLEKLAKREHPTFNDILAEVKAKMPSISASTVYSILKLLEESGVVVSFEHGGRTYFDSAEPHVNVICVDTGRVMDLDDGELVDEIRRRGIVPTSVVIKGICGSDVDSSITDRRRG